jgi:O-antigen/teichoic acid export membrane protein
MDKSIKQKLFSGGLWVVIGKIIALPSSLAVIALLSRLLNPEQMGVYFLIFSVVNFSVMFSLLGMELSIVRILSESLTLNQSGRVRNAIKYMLQLGLLSSITVAVLLVSGIGQLLSKQIFNSILMSEIIYYPAIWLILFTIQRLIAEAFRGLHDIQFATIFNGLISNIISAIVLGFIFWKYGKADITLTLSVIISAYALNLIFAYAFLVKRTDKLSSRNTGTISRTDIMKTSWPLYFSFIALSGLQQSHLWLLGYYSTKESVAIFGAVFRIMIIITASLEIVRLIIPPMISQLYTQKRYSEVAKVLCSTATIAGVPSIIGLFLIIFFGKSLLYYLYGNHYTMGYTALIVMSVAYLVDVLTGTPGILLIMASKEKILLLFSIISGSIGISLSILLVNSMDFVGVAIGAGIGIIVQNLLMAFYCFKKMSINTFMSFNEALHITSKVRYAIVNDGIYNSFCKLFK